MIKCPCYQILLEYQQIENFDSNPVCSFCQEGVKRNKSPQWNHYSGHFVLNHYSDYLVTGYVHIVLLTQVIHLSICLNHGFQSCLLVLAYIVPLALDPV